MPVSTHAARLVTILAVATLALGGCSSSRKVAFSNLTDTWVNVRVFVSTPDAATPEATEMVFTGDERLQIEPGGVGACPLSRRDGYVAGASIVHVHVQPVGPSWNASGIEYWVELLTPPPVNVVATGSGDTMTFNAPNGAVAVIPAHELDAGRFDHQMAGVTE